jgi:hypothetical protein
MGYTKKMKYATLLLLFFMGIFSFGEERIEIIVFDGVAYGELFLQIKYNTDQINFVSDELIDSEYLYVYEATGLVINYFPRGNYIRNADERIFWPIRMKKIVPNDVFVVRIDLQKILSQFEDIDKIQLVVWDNIFSLTNPEESLLFPWDITSQKTIKSDRISITKIPGMEGWFYLEVSTNSKICREPNIFGVVHSKSCKRRGDRLRHEVRERRKTGETFRDDLMRTTGNRASHPEGWSTSLEASLAWALATKFVKRRQRAQKPCY